MAQETPITKKGHEAVEAELKQLINVAREDIKVAIAEARALGDLSENAEYQYAKEKQSHIEGRIQQLQGILATAKIIDVAAIKKGEKITFGATVTIVDTDSDKTLVYQIVGNDEADLAKGKISFQSPLGRALIGKEEGDTVLVKAPRGDIEYEIDSFEYIA